MGGVQEKVSFFLSNARNASAATANDVLIKKKIVMNDMISYGSLIDGGVVHFLMSSIHLSFFRSRHELNEDMLTVFL